MSTLEMHGAIYASLPEEAFRFRTVELAIGAGLYTERGRPFVLATLVRENSPTDLVAARDSAAADLDPLLLAASLAHGRSIRAEWGGGRLLATPSASIFGISPPIYVAKVRAPLRALSTYRSGAEVVATHQELAVAIGRWRDSFDYLRTDQAASMSLAYLSVAVVVNSSQGNDTKRAWLSAAVAANFGRDDMAQLYDSLQFGRHANQRIAIDSLRRAQRQPLSAHDCCFIAADFIDAYRIKIV